MEISGHTQMLCLIGSPVGHSGSPAMYNYSFQKLGLDYVYLAFDIKEEDTSKETEQNTFHQNYSLLMIFKRRVK